MIFRRCHNCHSCPQFIVSRFACRTSGSIFALQMETAGLTEKLKDLIDIVYVNAPNPASGPAPPDVPADVFQAPYYEWWNAQQARRSVDHCVQAHAKRKQ